MYQIFQQVIDHLSINIELLFQRLEATSNKKQLSELEKTIICQSLLGLSRQQIANQVNLPEQNIRDRLSKYIYPRIAEVLEVDQKNIAGNWVMILNLLLNPNNGYKLNAPLQLNSDNFQGSFGRQFFIYPPNPEIIKLQIEGTQFYQQGLFYQALKCFLWAWKQEIDIYGKGNPEVLIYINNCLIEYKKNILQTKGIEIYTLAVVVPFHHNQGGIATEILRGISQIQLQVNIQSFDKINLEKEISLDEIRPHTFFQINNTLTPIALQILIVNDPNNLYTPYNQTAENLLNLAPELNLMAVIGHYSSEMTKKALEVYARNGMLLVNSSSTSNELSCLSGGERLSFFRLTTQDSISARRLANYLVETCSSRNFSTQTNNQNKVAIIYNKNSSYSISYRNAFKEYLEEYREQFVFLEECSYISGNYYQIQAYLENIKLQDVNIIIIIPDGGIEPLSLSNAWLISRRNLKNCLIAGSATLYQENVLHWIHEQSNFNSINRDKCQVIACIPWHYESQKNGCNSDNRLAQDFCQVGTQLWGEESLTWRSATAFDSVLIILRVLEKYRSQNSQSLLAHMNQYFKEQKNIVTGVTGIIEFNQIGDRVSPPIEIAAVKWNEQQQKWKWKV